MEENKENYGLEENLALLVWQGDTFKVTHLTDDYDKIRNVLGKSLWKWKDIEKCQGYCTPTTQKPEGIYK